MTDFHGCKGAFLCGDRVLCYLRDDKPGIPFPGHWDLPGGGREGSESPTACLLREMEEEFGLRLPADRLVWQRGYEWSQDPNVMLWFFGGFLTPRDIADIRFGDEGQAWQMMPIAQFLTHEMAVPHLKVRLAIWLRETGAAER
ncbi:MAG: NUDIX hydrolase [Rhodobacteraceae bacterium]|jgi:8-oxo-dGTP diphosphatase|nr:NUDIX hydrolase [Paracoccaceae bacterium]